MIEWADDTLRHEHDPKRSPAIAALEAVLYEGCQARIHVIYDGPATIGGRLIPGARVDRRRAGFKRHLITDGHGTPLAVEAHIRRALRPVAAGWTAATVGAASAGLFTVVVASSSIV
ncbi:hypothetical protein [Streptomyces sp. BK340]|uniref:hypothetical protein n=1 Tax=Streptomyces sp. BK340 TaxID=2572903 RepID=UPI0016465C8E|nr:hypothetical protein [Streptomyces sp. BK340]